MLLVLASCALSACGALIGFDDLQRVACLDACDGGAAADGAPVHEAAAPMAADARADHDGMGVDGGGAKDAQQEAAPHDGGPEASTCIPDASSLAADPKN